MSAPISTDRPVPIAPTTPRTIYLGTFISAPDPGPTSALCRRRGAVLVSPGPPGVIEKVDWTVTEGEEEEEARVRFGVEGERDEVKVVKLDGGVGRFWFPGFVGE
jgi:hypothetical protein